MKFLLVISAILLSATSAHAASSNSTGLGLTLGWPSGVTGRTWLTSENSIDYGAGWGLSNSDKFEVYSDYLWTRPGQFEVNGQKLDLFFGGGLVFRTKSGKGDDTVVFGPRIPVGVSLELTHPDIELFSDVALNVGLIPHSDVFVDFVVGARFFVF